MIYRFSPPPGMDSRVLCTECGFAEWATDGDHAKTLLAQHNAECPAMRALADRMTGTATGQLTEDIATEQESLGR